MDVKRTIHVVGIGPIGEPLINCLLKVQGLLKLDEITFDPLGATIEDLGLIHRLIYRGAKLAADTEGRPLYTALGIRPDYDRWEALEQATVIIDCSPENLSCQHQGEWYNHLPGAQGIIAPGHAEGFGMYYARGINDEALTPQGDRFIQVASRPVHTLAVLLDALALREESADNLIEGHFVCVHRAASSEHKVMQVGMREARETWHLFRTLDFDLDLFVWKLHLYTPYMPIVCFRLLLRRAVTRAEILAKLAAHPNVVLIRKTEADSILPLSEDAGTLVHTPHRTAVSVSSLNVKDRHELVGICRRPQTDNVLRSSFAAAVWRLDPSAYRERISFLEASLGLSGPGRSNGGGW
jgi:hypothetical protein